MHTCNLKNHGLQKNRFEVLSNFVIQTDPRNLLFFWKFFLLYGMQLTLIFEFVKDNNQPNQLSRSIALYLDLHVLNVINFHYLFLSSLFQHEPDNKQTTMDLSSSSVLDKPPGSGFSGFCSQAVCCTYSSTA